jgi:plastocyanin
MRTIIIRKNQWSFAMKRLLLLTLLLPLSAFAIGLLILTLLFPNVARADDTDAGYKLVINDHRFQPAELTIPSGTKIKLTVKNQDATPEEFDSHPLNREKVIAGRSTATIYIGPLAPGRYTFTGEFHSDTAQGVIIAQ